jgi:hypothetical protein
MFATLLGVLAGLASRAAPYRPGLAADRWSVGGNLSYARRPRRPYYGSISSVTATSLGKALPIKAGPTSRTRAAVFPTVRRRPPLEPSPQPLFRSPPAQCEPLDILPSTYLTPPARALTNPSRPVAEARAPAASASRHRRAPSLEPRPRRPTPPIDPR